ncbi:holin [Bacillus phage vB_BcM_Sam46]|uniref:Holin n=2 Tax=Caudoviricetes TaxID=2731619 RepID=A0A6G9L6N9_9CAUD|nr:holin [Bacillus phage vB_BcM_Sam112]QIQ61230.1 holin [Bacillus phage vB_BcM_Sam46]
MDTASLTRFVILIAGVLNAMLNLFGYQAIPDELINNVVLVVTGFYTLYMAWKNNFLSKRGQAQKEILKENNLH